VAKMKTRKSVKARFKITASGKLKRAHPGRRHLMASKNSKRRRNLRKRVLVDEAFAKTYRKIIGPLNKI
jgi:large subunit ribosomal protein L35